jgi:two-component system, sensor histidine kinase and response regulator
MNKILIIEDEPDLRSIVRQILEIHGFQVDIAEDGIQGVKQLKENRPDLVLCDVDMPKLDGFSVLSMVREEPETAMLPLILMTAKGERKNVRLGMELGANDYLTKPFTDSELLKAISTQLEKRDCTKRQIQKNLDDLRIQISSSLPHELNTPLHGILGMTSLLMEHFHDLDSEEVIELLQTVYSSAERLHHLVENFLLYAQLEIIDKTPNFNKPLRPVLILEHPQYVILEIAQNCAKKSQREPDLKLELQQAPIRISIELFCKAIEEIISNSFKFSQAGTPVHICCSVDNDCFTIRVIDQGRGMTTAQIESIGAYTQFDRNLYEQQGSGLGLAIAQRVARLYGGNLSIQSTAEPQTTVSFSLPTA